MDIRRGLVTVATLLFAGVADAQISLVPRTVHIDTFTCAELLALPSEGKDRILIYFDGYMNGTQRKTTWDERVEGEVVERAVEDCKADPSATVLSAFTRAAARPK
jgi:hypothetical protein